MGELNRAQEIRSDEFSRNELNESHATIHELTSQIQELQERTNYMNESSSKMQNRFEVENYLTFPVNRQAFQVLDDLC